jgi:hypothetical protein
MIDQIDQFRATERRADATTKRAGPKYGYGGL